ncbi:sulfotransferase [Sphingobium phenoxybenzoativorans]|uniref:sulfotransferase n=1 Tax=Sphingobium phenoxybenzoativorans TaxID=1592790 RepID=UPI0009F20CDF|nr:sulfotransferase [Sphingobium phenoxybenzoativorans]
MTANTFNTAIVVFGMHRSGTSALTRVLSLHGVGLPAHLLPANEKNEKGFWESPKINALNNAMLDQFEQNWSSINDLPPDPMRHEVFSAFKPKARRELYEEFAGAENVLIKDPRICRLADFWLDLLQDTAQRTVNVFTVRNPVEVARSLRSRNEFDLEFSYLLWLRYYLDAEFSTRANKRAFLDYHTLLDDWRPTLQRICHELDLTLRADEADVREIDEFLSPNLQHHRVEYDTALAEMKKFPLVYPAYEILHRAGRGNSLAPEDFSALDAIRASLNLVAPSLSPLVSGARIERKRAVGLKDQASAAQGELKRARASLENLSDLQRQAKVQATALVKLTTSHEETLKQVQTIRGELSKALAKASEAAAASAKLEIANARIAEFKKSTERLQEKLADGETKQKRLTKDNENKKNDLEALKDRHRALASKYDDIKIRQAQLNKNAAAVQDELDRARRQIQRSFNWRIRKIAGRIIAGVSPKQASVKRLAAKRQETQLNTIRQSDLFDKDWYLTKYADVGKQGVDPALHYLNYGWREGRDPSASFSTNDYLKNNSDVAGANINPLLHFIEHGMAEGRGPIIRISSPKKTNISQNFGLAHSCFRGEGSSRNIRPWLRWAEVEHDLTQSNIFLASTPIGAIENGTDPITVRQIQEVISLFRNCSGDIVEANALALFGEQAAENLTLCSMEAPHLIDAWFSDDFSIRSRWKVSDKSASTVMRGFQISNNGGYKLVGEGLLSSDLDCLDANLLNPFLPVLFLETTADGRFRSISLLPFPSLCRGGLHYPELLAIHDEHNPGSLEPINILERSAPMAVEFARLLAGDIQPLLHGVRVDLREADGTEAIFQPATQKWLGQCLNIALQVGPSDLTQTSAAREYLRQALSPCMAGNTAIRANAPLVLQISADSIPSIRSLTAPNDRTVGPSMSSGNHAAAAFICTGRDAASSKAVISLPGVAVEAQDKQTPSVKFSFPSYVSRARPDSANNRSPIPSFPAAVRMLGRRELSQAEIISPLAREISPLAIGAVPHDALVIIGSETALAPELPAVLETLHLQTGSDRLSIFIISGDSVPVSETVSSACDEFFKGRWQTGTSTPAKWSDLSTEAVIYIGQPVLFHDTRTIATLGAMLENEHVISATCSLIQSSEGKANWNTSVVFSGYVGYQDFGLEEAVRPLDTITWLPRSIYPVVDPGSAVWMAKANRLDTLTVNPITPASPRISLPPSDDKGHHLITSLVTATISNNQCVGLNADTIETTSSAFGMRIRMLRG